MKKGGLALLITEKLREHGKPEKSDDSEEAAEDDAKSEDSGEMTKDEAASDMMDAIEAGDKKAFRKALDAYMEVC